MARTMKAIEQDRYGSAEVLTLRDVRVPTPANNEVLIEVHAAGLDRGMWHLMTGRPYLVRIMGFGFFGPKQKTLGEDVAGRVVAIGDEVTRFSVGDEVFGIAKGSYAQYACAREDRLVTVPANLTLEQAAVVPTSALTALTALRDQAAIEPGQHVLIIGASGGVGSYATQLAKTMGAQVTGVCSTAKQDFVRSLGADHVIDYTREEITARGVRYDAILDIGGNRPVSLMRRALKPRGTLVFVGGEDGDRWLGGMLRPIGALVRGLFARKQAMKMFVSMPNVADLELLRDAIETGRLQPSAGASFSLADVPEAMRQLVAGKIRGKAVITMNH